MASKTFTLNNPGTIPVTIQSINFRDPPGIGHSADLTNLGGTTNVTGSATLSYNLAVGASQTFSIDYINSTAAAGTYEGRVLISGSDRASTVITSTIIIPVPTTTTTTIAPAVINSTLLSALSNTFSSNNADQTSIELIFYNSGRLTLTAYDSNATATTLTPGGNIDDFWITGSGSTPGNNYWMRITQLVGSLYVTPSTGWAAMTGSITISATGYPTFGQEGKWNIEIASDSAGSNIVGTISNIRFLPGAFNPSPSGG
jgi:hypothetical protein